MFLLTFYADIFGAKVWFNHEQQKERIDVDFIDIDTEVKQERVSILSHYDSVSNFSSYNSQQIFNATKILSISQGKQYFIHYNLTDNTASCKVAAISGKLEIPCLSKRATHRGRATIGGTLEVENWIEHVEDHQGKRVLVDILLAR